MSEHIDNNSLAALLQGLVGYEEREQIEKHIDECDQCRRLLADLARSADSRKEEDIGDEPTPEEQVIRRGAAVGRYLVQRKVGDGAMGVVYAATDPELGREVALKLLRPQTFEDTGHVEQDRSRLLREARAMARLSHPNVVAIHDAGEFGDRVFVVSEFVRGANLRQWLQLKPRTWREIVEVFIQAGRGLAAVHAAGLVHRDFKPDNVLLGNDGRVRLTDFGLAGNAGQPPESPAAADRPGADLLSPRLTVTGMMLGTPVYMAPEQHAGGQASAATDQYAFCTALYEALCGLRPVRADTYEELIERARHGRLDRTFGGVRLPRRLQYIVMQGLQSEPNARFVSMDALVHALRRVHNLRIRRFLVAASIGVLTLSSGLAFLLGQAAYSDACRRSPCMETVWSTTRQQSIQRAFTSSGAPYHAHAFARVKEELDAYASHWHKAWQTTCRSGSGRELHLRLICLERRCSRMRALCELFDRADAQVVERAVTAVRSLGALEVCTASSIRSLPPAPPKDPDIAAHVELIREELDAISALRDAGKYQRGLQAMDALREQMQAIDYPALQAEAMLLQGDFKRHLARTEEAEADMHEALRLADLAGHDWVRARAYTGLAVVNRTGVDDVKATLRWADLAEAVIERMGGDDLLAAKVANTRALALADQGDRQAAIQTAERALALFERLDHPHVVAGHHTLGTTLRRFGLLERASRHLEQSVLLSEKNFGINHPTTGKTAMSLGIFYAVQEKYDQAGERIRQSLQVQRETLGEKHPEVARCLANLGNLYLKMNDLKRATEAFDRCADIVGREQEPPHAVLAYCLQGSGRVLLNSGRAQKAVAALEQAEKMIAGSGGTESVELASVRYYLARAVWAAHRDRNRARELAGKSLATFQRHQGTRLQADEVEGWIKKNVTVQVPSQ